MLNKKHILLQMILVIIFLVLLTSCAVNETVISEKDTFLYVVNDQSLLSHIENDERFVYYYCCVSITNNYDDNYSVQLIGDFQEEYDAGIILSATSIATENGNQTIELPANSTKTVDIVFKCELNSNYKESELKLNRSLPSIKISGEQT